MGNGKRCGKCSACIAKKKKKGRKRACEHPIEKQSPRVRKQKSEAELLDCDISPAAFRLPEEPKAVPLAPLRKQAIGVHRAVKPSCEKGLDPKAAKAATQIRHLKQQLQELDTKVAGAFLCSFAHLLSLSLTACDRSFLGGLRVQQQLAFASEIKKEAKRRERQGREGKERQGEAREGKGRQRKAEEREGTATR